MSAPSKLTKWLSALEPCLSMLEDRSGSQPSSIMSSIAFCPSAKTEINCEHCIQQLRDFDALRQCMHYHVQYTVVARPPAGGVSVDTVRAKLTGQIDPFKAGICVLPRCRTIDAMTAVCESFSVAAKSAPLLPATQCRDQPNSIHRVIEQIWSASSRDRRIRALFQPRSSIVCCEA